RLERAAPIAARLEQPGQEERASEEVLGAGRRRSIHQLQSLAHQALRLAEIVLLPQQLGAGNVGDGAVPAPSLDRCPQELARLIEARGGLPATALEHVHPA